MPETLIQNSALTRASSAQGVHIRQIEDVGKIDLRGNPSDRAFMSAVGRSLDILLPTEPCTSIQQQDKSALWLGPDQWLITCPRDQTIDVIGKLDKALGSVHSATTDVSVGRIVIRLTGPNVRDVLAKGCPLDLHEREVKLGYVAGSVLAKITALIHLQDDEAIDLYVGRSFADYIWAWLESAGLEYGVTSG